MEYGVTTGRRRKVNWLNFDLLRKAVDITGPTQIIVNKVDVLEQIGIYKIILDGEIKQFINWDDMAEFISKDLVKREVDTIWFSRDPEEII